MSQRMFAVSGSDGKTYWSCGCVTYMQGSVFKVERCSDTCIVVTTVLRIAKEERLPVLRKSRGVN